MRHEITVTTTRGSKTYVYEGPDKDHLVLSLVRTADNPEPVPYVTDGQGRYIDKASAFPGDLTNLPENSTPERSQTDKAWHDPAFGGGQPTPPNNNSK